MNSKVVRTSHLSKHVWVDPEGLWWHSSPFEETYGPFESEEKALDSLFSHDEQGW